jgi:DNA repair exonuclease SbcCD nuclease subunit
MTNLFKKAAVFTDIHFGLKNNSIQHNEDCLQFVEWFIATAKKHGCETCFFLGDWNHNRATINVLTQNYSLRALEKLNENFEKIYFIVGNHDLYYRDRRDVQSMEWAKHLDRIIICNDWIVDGDCIIAPWLIGEDYKKLQKLNAQYLFGHFELPSFYMNAMVEMPDHGEINRNQLQHFDHVFTGHFHKRQTKGNITYIGNAFPHNYSDVNDDDRGMMILAWGDKPTYHSWPNQPKFRTYNLTQILENPDSLLIQNGCLRITIDTDISYEESSSIKETIMKEYKLREMTMIPQRVDIETDNNFEANLQFESVDAIVLSQIEQLDEGKFDKQLLLNIYKNL